MSFAVSLGVGYLTLRYAHLHARFSADVASRGSHKVHRSSVSRIGGVSIFIGWLVSIASSAYLEKLPWESMLIWVGSSRVDLQACKLEYSIVSPK